MPAHRTIKISAGPDCITYVIFGKNPQKSAGIINDTPGICFALSENSGCLPNGIFIGKQAVIAVFKKFSDFHTPSLIPFHAAPDLSKTRFPQARKSQLTIVHANFILKGIFVLENHIRLPFCDISAALAAPALTAACGPYIDRFVRNKFDEPVKSLFYRQC
ncbi:MAG: hypothetical protein KFF46_00375 [Desulfobacterales bacterium]|nr:hypothetical protein [Desulfobacterales bacterium]